MVIYKYNKHKHTTNNAVVYLYDSNALALPRTSSTLPTKKLNYLEHALLPSTFIGKSNPEVEVCKHIPRSADRNNKG